MGGSSVMYKTAHVELRSGQGEMLILGSLDLGGLATCRNPEQVIELCTIIFRRHKSLQVINSRKQAAYI